MTHDPTPPGTHPTDAMLLLLGDVRSDVDAAEFVAELRLDVASGTLTAEDPFAPASVVDSWSHLGACSQCSWRREALFAELAPSLTAAASEPPPGLASALDSRVGAAVAELEPTAAAVPVSLTRPVPPPRRWFSGRAGIGIGNASGHSGTVASPWIVAIAAAALLLAVGAAFALRPRTTEQSAVGTVPPSVDRAASSDTTSVDASVFAETEAAAAAETAASLAAGAVTDEPAANPPATTASPATTAKPSVDEVTPVPAAPEAATESATNPPVEPSPARASSKTTTESADAAMAEADPAPPQPARKKASAPATVASAAAAAGTPAGSGQLTAAADLGTFADAESALDRFAARAAISTDAAPTQLGQPAAASAANTASPAADPSSAAAAPTEPVLCPTVKGSPRLRARIGDRAVLVVRTAEATADAVLDAVSCTELARRSVLPTTAPLPTPPPVGG